MQPLLITIPKPGAAVAAGEAVPVEKTEVIATVRDLHAAFPNVRYHRPVTLQEVARIEVAVRNVRRGIAARN